jgi:hypothetical protein
MNYVSVYEVNESLPANQRLHPTPLRVDKIGGILVSRCARTTSRSIGAARVKRHSLGRTGQCSVLDCGMMSEQLPRFIHSSHLEVRFVLLVREYQVARLRSHTPFFQPQRLEHGLVVDGYAVV